MIDDLTERAWWVYELPSGAICYVPAPSEPDARKAMAATHYKDAPVDEYAFVASRWTSRAAIVRSILGERAEAARQQGQREMEP